MKERLVKKIRKKEANKMIERIKAFNLPFKSVIYSGYFFFSFTKGYNLHVIFNDLPRIKFGIWKTDQGFEFFADHIYYIDKFKPSRSSWNFNSLEEMMQQVKVWINDKVKYLNDMKDAFGCPTIAQWLEDENAEKVFHEDYIYRNGLSKEEYSKAVKDFNNIIDNLDPHFDIFWRKSDGFRNLYDTWIYLYAENNDLSQSDADFMYSELEDKLFECKCFNFGDRPLPKMYESKKYFRKYIKYKVNIMRINYYDRIS